MDYKLECLQCGAEYDSAYASQVCARCNGILEVVYAGRIAMPNGRSFWDFESALPKGTYKHYAVGGTDMVASEDSGLFLKLELRSQTRSFKDLGSVIEVAKAYEYGYKDVVCASTGNMAYSIAYYSKLYGIRAHIFISSNANKDKIYDIKSTNDAVIKMVDGDFNKALDTAALYSRKKGFFLSGDYCYRKEGQKLMAYEIMQNLPEVANIIIPVGNATLFSGIYKGLKEMKASGRIKKLPRLIAVEAKGCSPVVDAFNSKSGIKYRIPKTKADAIAVGFPTFGVQALEGLNKTMGMAVAVTDNEMERSKEKLYKEKGIIAELGGVASFAAYEKIKDKIGINGVTVAIISGGNI